MDTGIGGRTRVSLGSNCCCGAEGHGLHCNWHHAGPLVVSADGPWPRVEDRRHRAHSGSSIPVLQDGKVLELYCPKWKCTLR